MFDEIEQQVDIRESVESDFMIPIHLNFTDSDAWSRFLAQYAITKISISTLL